MNAQLKSIFKKCMDEIKNDGKQTVELNKQVAAPGAGSGASAAPAAASGAPKSAREAPAPGSSNRNHKGGNKGSDGAARISGLPASCISAAKEVNALPNIAEINKAQGTMTIPEGSTDTLILAGGPVEKLAKKLLAADKGGKKNGSKASGTGAKASATGAKSAATGGVKAAVM